MTATEIPVDVIDGIDAVTPAPAPATAAAPVAAPAPVAAAAPVAPAAAPATGTLLDPAKPNYNLKAESLHADDLKAFTDVLGEHKADSKLGQAILDKMLPAFKARSEQRLSEAQAEWRAENAKNAASEPLRKLALSVVSPETAEGLRNEVFVDHPALYRFVAEVGAFVQKATKQDTAVPGTSPSTASQFQGNDTRSEAFASGLAGGF
jgi:hypothetical protein